ncbi:hypothetical protein B0H17DRAFT_1149518 [Mycena rosella]|uniref:Uncharacterized protein n=1 Tax=Mycena rosella TaxID=1033263 RepID=A0AAD7FQN5_MYCRO|nr:hypothetical protein B0H17DRAFT_1149518 [Mycena rosella]
MLRGVPAARNPTAPDPHQALTHRLHAPHLLERDADRQSERARPYTQAHTPLARMREGRIPAPTSIRIAHGCGSGPVSFCNTAVPTRPPSPALSAHTQQRLPHGMLVRMGEYERMIGCQLRHGRRRRGFRMRSGGPDTNTYEPADAGEACVGYEMCSGKEDAEQRNGDIDPLAATDKGLSEMKVGVSGDPTSFGWRPKEAPERAPQEQRMPYIRQSSKERQAEIWPWGRQGTLRVA